MKIIIMFFLSLFCFHYYNDYIIDYNFKILKHVLFITYKTIFFILDI